jgi:UDP-N-acetylglucosamine 1-carboxyvinyltransferase
MDRLVIGGGYPLNGEAKISGAKNSVLPIMAASLLADQALNIDNIPHLKDVTLFVELLGQMGAQITVNADLSIAIDTSCVHSCIAPYQLVSKMRASILVLGPLLARFGQAKVALPGGCAIGSRPIDLHVEGLKMMGAEICIEDGYINAVAPKGLTGTEIFMSFPSVTATENLILAATLAKGTTRIVGGAKEPEIMDLIQCLQHMGAKIVYNTLGDISIEGSPHLSGGRYHVLPDRIETGTYLVAATMTSGSITLTHTNPAILETVIVGLRQAGATVETTESEIYLSRSESTPLKPVDLCTGPYPGFPTDMQAQFMALNCIASGDAVIKETIFENRFMHVDELRRMGAKVKVQGNVAIVTGGTLKGAPVRATDLRASASLVLAGLVAQGQTTIHEIYHIDRGYECLEEKLVQMRAHIRRLAETLEVEKTHVDSI